MTWKTAVLMLRGDVNGLWCMQARTSSAAVKTPAWAGPHLAPSLLLLQQQQQQASAAMQQTAAAMQARAR
jgi:hypothetical protein